MSKQNEQQRFIVHYTKVSRSTRTEGRSRTLIFFDLTVNDERPQHISSNDLSDIVQRTIDYFQIDSYIQIENWDPIMKRGYLAINFTDTYLENHALFNYMGMKHVPVQCIHDLRRRYKPPSTPTDN